MAQTLIRMKAEVLKALGHPTRLALVECLGRQGEQCVCVLAELVACADRTTISKHLAILRAAGIVSDRKEGLKVFYRLSRPCVNRILTCIEQMVLSRVRQEQAVLNRK